MPANPIIEADGLTRHYGARVAVDHIHFTINRGEVFGFLGPNGAGKSTTVRMLTGYIPPTSGIARIGGCDIVCGAGFRPANTSASSPRKPAPTPI